MDEKTIATPTSRYGSRLSGTLAFINLRLTGVLLVAFTIFFIWIVVRLARADVAAMAGLLGNPVVAIVTALMLVATAFHMQAGMREVIEDYVHDAKLYRLGLMLNTLFSWGIVLVTLIALGKLVFWG
jgi:succinate dehydrogenase / fumarate reductase membrane anchor subunit